MQVKYFGETGTRNNRAVSHRGALWSLLIALISSITVCHADLTNALPEIVSKSDAQAIKGVDFWIDVVDVRQFGLLRLRIGSANFEEFGLTNAEKITIDAKSPDGLSLPAPYFTRATAGLTTVDYLLASGDSRKISRVTVTWKNETKNFKMIPVNVKEN
ncbi:MAG TPA: hypothetical protein VG938_05830 [Verrucomicrobiae bacterium]|nr:hypothetical protein [Verrucomicrobiae bacterium]